ncbi:MAG: hypothetical protein U5K38_07560 [Woeseiaceae bacterium]|nr:hypothetical protein [Woeseiaceae bacterium]
MRIDREIERVAARVHSATVNVVVDNVVTDADHAGKGSGRHLETESAMRFIFLNEPVIIRFKDH